MIKYRGKYPNRLESGWIVTRELYERPLGKFHGENAGKLYKEVFPQFTPGMYCRTNCGKIYRYIGPLKHFYPIGEVNDVEYVFIEQSTKRS